jgi:hypothetical protein
METNYFPPTQIFVSSTDVQPISLPSPLVVPSAYSVYMSLVEAQIPVSSYNCMGDSIQFALTGGLYVIDVPDGCYSHFELAELINHSTTAAFNQTDPIGPGTVAHMTFGAEYLPSLNKFRLFARKPSLLTDIRLMTTPLAVKLGFVGTDLSKTSIDQRPGGVNPTWVWTPALQTTFAPVRNFYVSTDIPLRNSAGRPNCIAKIPVDADFNEVVSWNCPNKFAAQLAVNEVSNFTFAITDDAGLPIDFQGAPWSATLQFVVKNPDASPIRE